MCSRRFPLFALSLFLALLLFPSCALAYDFIPKGLVYSADLDGSRFGAAVAAANQFDAACYALGKEPSSISTSIRSKLSDPNYGGRFYEFSQAFYTQGWPLEHVPDWLPAFVWGSLELNDLLLSDYQSVWYVTCTQSLRAGALVDFLAVLNGEDLGGGGSGGGGSGDVSVSSSYQMTKVPAYASSTKWVWAGSTKVVFDSAPATCTLNFNESSRAAIKSVLDSGFDIFIYHDFSNYSEAGSLNFSVKIIQHGATLDISDNLVTVVNNTGGTLTMKNCGVSFSSSYDGVPVYDCNFSGASGSLSFNPTSTAPIGWYTYRNKPRFFGAYYLALYSDGTSSGEPVIPPPAGTWPEPSSPAAPVEPAFPDPASPTVQPDPVVTEPTVTWPSPTITVDPDPVPGTTPTGLDYTELLTRINDNLISIDSFARAINSNLNSLRSDLVSEFNGVVQGLRNIYSYLQHLDSVLERHCVHLQNKLEDVSVDIQNKIREMVRWLADELDFGSEESGNSSLFGILSTINDKLGGGTYEPNPLKSEDAYYEWLDDLWDRFLLGDNWQSSASSMSQSFGQLTSRFPFSVPWDIVALFRLFVHDPVTPVFDLPLYYSSEDSATVRVDLSAWDGVASVVRPLVFVIFALKLALLSRHLLAGFGADKGGL